MNGVQSTVKVTVPEGFNLFDIANALEKAGVTKRDDFINLVFNKEYVKTDIFPREMGRRIAGVEEIRHASDYDDFYFATIDEVNEQIATAEEFIALVEQYCCRELQND